MNQIILNLRNALKADADEKTKNDYERFFKEEVKYYGVKSGPMKMIGRKFRNQIKILDKAEIFLIFEEMLKSGYCEEAFLVSDWLPRLKKQFELGDLAIFKNWIDKYLNNWAKIDSFCNHTVGEFIEKFPESISEVMSWGKSENRWMKRASAVSLIVPAKRGKYLKEAFEISDRLLSDKDDMVQKGYGWLLKEESRQHQKEVFDYVVKNRAVMPRTALRYAIELMPQELRVEAMKKDSA